MQKTNTILEDIKRIIKTVDYLYENDFNYPIGSEETDDNDDQISPKDSDNTSNYDQEIPSNYEDREFGKEGVKFKTIIDEPELKKNNDIKQNHFAVNSQENTEMFYDIVSRNTIDPNYIKPSEVFNFFKDNIFRKVILCPTKEKWNFKKNKISKNLSDICSSYYYSIQNNMNGKLGQMLELLYGQVPHPDPNPDLGSSNKDSEDKTEMKTKNIDAKSGIIGISRRQIQCVDQIFDGGSLNSNMFNKLVNDVLDKQITIIYKTLKKRFEINTSEYKYDFFYYIPQQTKLNSLSIGETINIDKLFVIELKKELISSDMVNTVLKFYLNATISTKEENGKYFTIFVFHPQYDEHYLDVNECPYFEDFSVVVPFEGLLKMISAKCPNLFVAKGTFGKLTTKSDAEPFLNLDDSEPFRVDKPSESSENESDMFYYTQGELFKWNKDSDDELLKTLIEKKFINIDFSMSKNMYLQIGLSFNYNLLLKTALIKSNGNQHIWTLVSEVK